MTQPFRAGTALWGPRRAALGVSLRRLEDLTGINRGMLSQMERGRLFPSADEYARVTRALDEVTK